MKLIILNRRLNYELLDLSINAETGKYECLVNVKHIIVALMIKGVKYTSLTFNEFEQYMVYDDITTNLIPVSEWVNKPRFVTFSDSNLVRINGGGTTITSLKSGCCKPTYDLYGNLLTSEGVGRNLEPIFLMEFDYENNIEGNLIESSITSGWGRFRFSGLNHMKSYKIRVGSVTDEGLELNVHKIPSGNNTIYDNFNSDLFVEIGISSAGVDK